MQRSKGLQAGCYRLRIIRLMEDARHRGRLVKLLLDRVVQNGIQHHDVLVHRCFYIRMQVRIGASVRDDPYQ
ncbi:hypothetical protein D3C73_1558870 [compost metagenome]